MRYNRLGNSGLQVSVVGLGGNTFGRYVDAAGTARIVHRALELGINFFDTADVYSAGVSEQYLGQALRGHRDRALIATKVAIEMGEGPNNAGLSRQHIVDGVENSLRRLGVDHIDLLQTHRWDPVTPVAETMRALDDLVRAGKVRYIGCSNYAAWQLTEALWIADKQGYTPFVSVQPRYNLFDRTIERELLPACRRLGVGVIPFSPLAGGVLTGKYLGGQRPAGARGLDQPGFFERQLAGHDDAAVARLAEWAGERGHTIGELALAWLASHSEVATIIAGATGVEQVEANARAAEWALAPDEIEAAGALTAQPR